MWQAVWLCMSWQNQSVCNVYGYTCTTLQHVPYEVHFMEVVIFSNVLSPSRSISLVKMLPLGYERILLQVQSLYHACSLPETFMAKAPMNMHVNMHVECMQHEWFQCLRNTEQDACNMHVTCMPFFPGL